MLEIAEGVLMEVEFLGVGSGLSPELGNNNVLLKSNTSHRQVLVDCGFSTPPELSKRSTLNQITDILITHLHSDHIGGLELLGFTSFYVHRNLPNAKKITLHLPTATMKRDLWKSLKQGMASVHTAEAGHFEANLETYFDISIGEEVTIDGFSDLKFSETEHVKNMEAYSVWLNSETYYSSDTTLLPPETATTIFQDCQLFDNPTSVHTSFTDLNNGMSDDAKTKTWLMHYGFTTKTIDPTEYGFKGFVKRFQKFNF